MEANSIEDGDHAEVRPSQIPNELESGVGNMMGGDRRILVELLSAARGLQGGHHDHGHIEAQGGAKHMLKEVLEGRKEANRPGDLQSWGASFQHGRERPIDAHPVERRGQAGRPKRN